MKPFLPKRLFATLITTSILFSLNIVPANAAPITYHCLVGSTPTGTFTILDNVVTISSFDCAGAVNIPSGVLKIEMNVFYDRNLITSVTIPNTVTEIGRNAFLDTSLVSLVIPDSVVTIGDFAFSGTDLTSVTFGNGLTTIGERAFDVATLTSVTFGNSLTTIGNYAFSGTGLTSVTFPNSVTTIRLGAFEDNSSLNFVTFGNRLQTIGTRAFKSTGLSEVTIPNSVTIIGEDAFAAVSSLTAVNLGNSLTEIGYGAFRFTSLSSVTIPSSVTDILLGAFEGVSTLTSVTFLGNAPTTASDAFSNVGIGARANVAYNATGFPLDGDDWKGLIVRYASAPPVDVDSSSSKTDVTITPTVVKTADASFKLTNRKYLSKYALKTKLSKNKSFKRNPKDLYKYSILKTSKKSCVMSGNYLVALKETGACEIWVTRTTPKGAKYKYWVQINYNK